MGKKRTAAHHCGAAQRDYISLLKSFSAAEPPPEAEVGEPPAAPPLIVAEQLHPVTLEEGELGVANYALHCIAQVVGAEAVGTNLWREDFTESRLAVGHVANRVDVEDAVVHEPGITLMVMEGMAVGSLYAAVRGEPEMQQARLGYVAVSQVAQKHLNAHAFIVVGWCDHTHAVGVRPVHGLYNLSRWRGYAFRYVSNYAHINDDLSL